MILKNSMAFGDAMPQSNPPQRRTKKFRRHLRTWTLMQCWIDGRQRFIP